MSLDSFKDIVANSGFKTTTIKGTTYMFELLPAFPAAEVGAKLIELLGPSFGALFDGIRREEYILPDESTICSEVAIELSKSLGKADVISIIKLMLYNVQVNGRKIDVDNHFKGDLSGFVQLVEAALKENFGESFLDYCEAKGFVIPSLKDLKILGQREQTTEDSQS